MTINDKYDFLHEVVGVSQEALDLAFFLKPMTEQTASDILWYFTGYSDFKAYMEDIGM